MHTKGEKSEIESRQMCAYRSRFLLSTGRANNISATRLFAQGKIIKFLTRNARGRRINILIFFAHKIFSILASILGDAHCHA